MLATAQLSRLSSAESATAQTRRAASRWAAWSVLPAADAFVRAAAMVSNDSSIPKELWAALDIAASGHFEPAFSQVGTATIDALEARFSRLAFINKMSKV